MECKKLEDIRGHKRKFNLRGATRGRHGLLVAGFTTRRFSLRQNPGYEHRCSGERKAKDGGEADHGA